MRLFHVCITKKQRRRRNDSDDIASKFILGMFLDFKLSPLTPQTCWSWSDTVYVRMYNILHPESLADQFKTALAANHLKKTLTLGITAGVCLLKCRSLNDGLHYVNNDPAWISKTTSLSEDDVFWKMEKHICNTFILCTTSQVFFCLFYSFFTKRYRPRLQEEYPFLTFIRNSTLRTSVPVVCLLTLLILEPFLIFCFIFLICKVFWWFAFVWCFYFQWRHPFFMPMENVLCKTVRESHLQRMF